MNRPLRIAWITFFPVEWLPEAPEEIQSLPKGHPASWQRVLLRELQKDSSIELHIFAIRKTFPRDVIFTSGNATFYCLRAPGSLRAPSMFWVDTWLLKRHIRRIEPDVVHAWGMEQAAGLVAARLKRPYLVSMQGIFCWLNGRVKLNRYEKLMAWLESRLFPKAPCVTVEAGFAVDFLHQKWPEMHVEQVEHAPDPIFAQTPRQNEPAKVRFLSMGGITALKGGDLLLRCLAGFESQMPFEVVAVGAHHTPLLDKLRAELPVSLFERIRFESGLTPLEVAREMAGATILIYPTRGDTSPNSVKEAVVHGLPVVSSRVGGIPDYVVDGENGILFEPDNLDALCEGVRRALQDPLFQKGHVQPNRLAECRRQLSAETMALKFTAIYRTLRRG